MRVVLNPILFVIEYVLKIAAPLASTISLAAEGTLGTKIGAGFTSLPQAVRNIVWWIDNLPRFSTVIDDYNTLTAAAFNQKYGGGAVNGVMQYLNEGVDYLQNVAFNLSVEPLVTIIAALVVFSAFYLVGRTARFIRQQGQGSVIDRMERRMGDRVFRGRRPPTSPNNDDA